jgi:fibronectin-binding autotransporter adhesin
LAYFERGAGASAVVHARRQRSTRRKVLLSSTALVGAALAFASPAGAQQVTGSGTGNDQTAANGGYQRSGTNNNGVTVTNLTLSNSTGTPTGDGYNQVSASGQSAIVGTSGDNDITTTISGGAALSLSTGGGGNLLWVQNDSATTLTGSTGARLTASGFIQVVNGGGLIQYIATGSGLAGIEANSGTSTSLSLGAPVISGFDIGILSISTQGSTLTTTGGSIDATGTGILLSSSSGIDSVDSQSAIVAPNGIALQSGNGASVTTRGAGTIDSTSAGSGTGISAQSSAGTGDVTVTVGASIGGTSGFQVGVDAATNGTSTGRTLVSTTAAIATGSNALSSYGIRATSSYTAPGLGSVSIGADVTGGTAIDLNGGFDVTVAAGATVTGNADGGSFFDTGFGIHDNSSLGSIANAGTITATGANGVGIYNAGGVHVTNAAGATISGSLTGLYNQNNGLVDNDGTILGGSGAGYVAFGNTLNNSGDIAGASGVLNSGNIFGVINSGTITGTAAAGNGLAMTGGFLRLLNSGLVQTAGGTTGLGGAGVSIDVAATVLDQQVTNSGTISGGGDAVHGFGVEVLDGAFSLENQAGGTIQGGLGAIDLASDDSASLTLDAGSTTGRIVSSNSGARTVSVAGELSGDYDASAGTGASLFTLASTGAMQGTTFGSADDSFIFEGGSIAGAVDGGAGTDAFTSILGSGSAVLNLSNLTGFEAYAHQSGTLTLTGSKVDPGYTAGWLISAGTTLNIAGSLSAPNAYAAVQANPVFGTTTVNVLAGGSFSSWVGVYFNGGAAGVFSNAGTVTGASLGVFGGSGTIDAVNSGTITAGIYEGISFGFDTSSLVNSGTLTGGSNAGQGFGASARFGTANITNSIGGFISGGAGGLLGGLSSGGTDYGELLSVENDDGAAIAGPVAIQTHGSAALTLTNAGQVIGSVNAINAAGTGPVDITNAAGGVIATGTLASAGAVYTPGPGGNAIELSSAATIRNDGLIAGQSAGILSFARLDLSNSGTIHGLSSGTSGTGDGIFSFGALDAVNSGLIDSSTYSAIVALGGGSIVNAAGGSLNGGNDSTFGEAVQFNMVGGSFTNYGIASSATGRGVATFGDGATTISLQAGSTTGDILTGNGDDRLTLYNGRGTVGAASVDAASGILLQQAGTLASASFGSLDLGGGTNTIELRGAGDGTLTNGAAGIFSLAAATGASILTKADSGTWTLTGSAVTPSLAINAGSGGVAGSGGLLIFDGTAGLTGAITVNGATIRADSAGAFGTGTIVALDPTIQFNADGNYLNNILLASANPASDPTRIELGQGVTASLDGQISESSADQPLTFGLISGANSATVALTNAANSWTGTTTIEAGVTLAGSASSISGSALADDGALQITQSTAGTLGQPITGIGTLTLGGSGTLTLSGANSYSGLTTVDGGTLALAGGQAIADANTILVNSGGTLSLLASEQIGALAGSGNVDLGGNRLTLGTGNLSSTFSGVIAGSGDIDKVGTGSLILGGSNLFTGTLSVAGGTLIYGADDVLADTATLNVLSGATLDLAGHSDTIGTFNLYGTLTGGGVLIASSYNLFAGSIVDRALGTGPLNVFGDSLLSAATSATPVNIYSGTLTVAGTDLLGNSAMLQIAAPGQLSLQGNQIIGGLADLDGGAGSVDLAGNDLTVGAGDGDSSFSGTIAGSDPGSSLTKAGSGTFILTGVNSFSGPAVVDGGTLALGGGQAVADSTSVTVNAGGTLALLTSERVASIAGDGTIDLGSNTLFLGTGNSSSTFSGIASGTGGMTQTGSGTLTLSGANSYSGTTWINGGTLVFGGSNVLGDSSTLNLVDATASLGSSSDTIGVLLARGSAVTGTGTLSASQYGLEDSTVNAKLGAGYLYAGTGNSLSTLNGLSGATIVEVQAGTLRLGASDRLLDSATLYVDRGSVFDLQGFNETIGSLSLGGALNGTGTLDAATSFSSGGTINANLSGGALYTLRDPFTGASVTTLNGTASLATVQVNGNTSLVLGASDRLADTANVLVASGGTFDLGGHDDTVGALLLLGTLDGSGTLTAATATLNGGTVNAGLSTPTLNVAGGTSILNGAVDAASVNVSAGTLQLGLSDRLADTAAVTVRSGATLDLGANRDTVGTLILTGALDGSGTLTAANYELRGGTANANLGLGNLFQEVGNSTLLGTSQAGTVSVLGGVLTLGAPDRLADSSAVAVAGGATLDLGSNDETVGSLYLSGNLNGSGTLTAADYTLAGGIVNASLGGGALVQESGTSVLNGSSAAETVTVLGGSLRLGAAERLGDGAALAIGDGATFNLAGFRETVGTLEGSGTLALGTGELVAGTSNDDFLFSGAISGSGDFTKVGTGTAVLTGASSMTGAINVDAGTLLFAGTSAGSLRLRGGALTGAGQFGGSVALLSGTLSPGIAGQPLGSFTMVALDATGGVFNIDFGGAAYGFAADEIIVTGAASLDGITVVPTALDPTNGYRLSQSYTILQASSLSGTFANGATFAPVGNDPDLRFRLLYDVSPGAVVLEVRKQIDFTLGLPAGATANQLAVGEALNGGAFTASNGFAAALDAISAVPSNERGAVYDSIGGEAIADLTTGVALVAGNFGSLVEQRMADGGLLGTMRPLGNSAAQRFTVWLRATGSEGHIEGTSGSALLANSDGGVAGGVEGRFGTVTAGLAGSRSDVDSELRERLSSSHATLHQGGAYASFDDGRTFGTAVASYFTAKPSTRRTLVIGSDKVGTASSQASLHGYAADAAIGERLGLGGGFFAAPQVGGAVVRTTRAPFAETGGGSLGLTAEREVRTLYRFDAKARFSHRGIAPNGMIEPYASVGVRVNRGDLTAASDLRFTDAPDGTGAFTIRGAKLDRTQGLFAVGVNARPSRNVTMGAAFEADAGARQHEERISFRGSLSF